MDWIMIAGISAAVLLAVITILIIVHRVNVKNGKAGKALARRILKGYASVRKYKVYSDITLLPGQKEVAVDLMMMGYFGILLVKTFDLPGELYGSRLDKFFIHVNKNDLRTKVPNLMMQMDEQLAALREILKKEKIYNIGIDPVIFVTNKKCNLFIQEMTHPMIKIKDFKRMLSKAKYEQDKGVDEQKLNAVIEKYCKK